MVVTVVFRAARQQTKGKNIDNNNGKCRKNPAGPAATEEREIVNVSGVGLLFSVKHILCLIAINKCLIKCGNY